MPRRARQDDVGGRVSGAHRARPARRACRCAAGLACLDDPARVAHRAGRARIEDVEHAVTRAALDRRLSAPRSGVPAPSSTRDRASARRRRWARRPAAPRTSCRRGCAFSLLVQATSNRVPRRVAEQCLREPRRRRTAPRARRGPRAGTACRRGPPPLNPVAAAAISVGSRSRPAAPGAAATSGRREPLVALRSSGSRSARCRTSSTR